MSRVRSVLALAMLAVAGTATAKPQAAAAPPREPAVSSRQLAFADTLERRTFFFFWDLSEPATGLMTDRWPARSFISVGAVGFALTAYPIGAERKWITRDEAATRTLRTLEFFWNARQDTADVGSTGYKGFFYHFLNPGSGTRFKDV